MEEYIEKEIIEIITDLPYVSAGFGEVRGFLDSIHRIIAPIMDECEGDASGDWFLDDDPFAVATWEWTDKGFRIIGTTY